MITIIGGAGGMNVGGGMEMCVQSMGKMGKASVQSFSNLLTGGAVLRSVWSRCKE